MVCIVCLATLAAVGFSAGVAAAEWLDNKLADRAENGQVVRETESVVTWRGDFKATRDDGSEKSVGVTLYIYKDSGRAKLHIEDHSLTQSEAERLEDEIMELLDAEIEDRRYPEHGPLPEGAEHVHEDEASEEAQTTEQRRPLPRPGH